jgi:diacylglycerol O-acyltransferase / wax synthase
MKQLSGADSMFLQLEHGNNFMHVASLAIYDPSTAPGGGVRFKDVLRFFAARLEQFPQFRRRLVTVPFSLDRPYWLEDSSFDVEFHVRHIALPYPGDWRQLCIQVARIHSRPLDRSKPLWEAYVIEGLHNIPGVPPGSFALYSKMHHAIVDGESGTEIMRALHSLSPEPIDPEAEEDGRYHMDRDPTAIELYSRALIHNMENVPALARFSFGTARRLATLGVGALGKMAAEAGAQLPSIRSILSGDLTGLLPKMPPQTRFSGDVSAHRIFEAVGLPLADFRVVRNRIPEATINDQFLAIVGGALREYLESKNELPDATMVAGVPLTLRGAEKGGDRGNQVGFTLMPVHTEIDDPLERLKAISADSIKAKRMTDAIGKELARDLLDILPNFVSGAMLRNVRMPRIGLIVSNVRGPDVPLYMAGARLVNYAPVSIPIDGLGLNVTGFSYAGTMWICAISCRDMLPDPGFFADCMRRSFARLKEAAQGDAAHAHATKLLPGRPKRAAAKRKPGRAAKRRAVRKATARG